MKDSSSVQISERLLLDVLGCVVSDREATYVSGPITTGRRYVEWRRAGGASLQAGSERYRQEHLRNVISPNRGALQSVVRRLRAERDGIIIDPTALEDVPGWEQDNYNSFWIGVIHRYVHTIVFVDGWEYSVGCVHEFVAALESGSALLTENLEPLDPAIGIASLGRALGGDVRDGVLPLRQLELALRRAEKAVETIAVSRDLGHA